MTTQEVVMHEPFTAEQVVKYITGLLRPEAMFMAIAGLIAGFLNYVFDAPMIWQACALLATAGFVLDIVTGVTRSWVVGVEKQTGDVCKIAFNSHYFGRAFIKFIVYTTVILMGMATDAAFHMTYFVATAALSAIAGREIISNFENCHALCKAKNITWPFAVVEKAVRKILEILSQQSK